ncbi:hypothetical protein ACIBG8_33445 [Nonomuraea sp. NPDC050556]|uniref:hypothetical protein n=1 Tax=Nonomuraea sp. NPDC050556 TaxID=3364369 RepID=UPI00379A780B
MIWDAASLLPQFREWHVLIWSGGYAAIRTMTVPNKPTVICAETLAVLRNVLEADRPHLREVS